MADAFRFEVSDEEKRYLKDLATASIQSALTGDKAAAPPPPVSEQMDAPLGAFVTLKKGEHLRGCIGHIVGDGPLRQTIWDMARAAAFQDPRFPPVTAAEWPSLRLEISILSPLTRCPDAALVEVGRHGLLLRKGGRQGLLLPQVPLEWGWDRDAFLQHTCRKASLPLDAWKDPATEIWWFEAVVF